MTPVHSLFIVIEDLLYSNNMNIDIILPYWNKKKEVGPQLVKILENCGIPRLSAKPQEWVVMTDKGPKRINFTTCRIGHVCSDTVVIPNDKGTHNE